ncbi:kinase-like domain-containing protein [Gigaspora margarita]|uniref:Kinase-like domain-containing protein n=1 Tax=Gigaspora margarita TaxID=4874 RepID=A0A8H3XMM5_GIGMA|nr:kinase-like domain-containing protein [Gigaspora margarita]
MTAYIDSKCFEYCKNKPYKCNKKSDIYSFRVILWEISSGRPPFESVKISRGANIRDIAILIQIQQGIREQHIEDNNYNEIVNMSKISNESQPSIILNNEIIQIPTKFIDDTWNIFIVYFLNRDFYVYFNHVI